MGDRLFGLLVIVAALAFGVSAAQTQTSFITDPFGPKRFPYLIAGVAVMAGIAIMLRPGEKAKWPPLAMALRLAAAAVVLIGYAITLKPLGFVVPTAIASGLLSYQIHSHVRTSVATGIGASVILFLIFKYALGLGLFAWPRFLF